MSVRYIDRPDIPAPILAALKDEYYNEGLIEHFEQLPEKVREKYGRCHYSVTTLVRAPRQRALFARHSHEVEVDPISGGFWKMLGHVIHAILEKHGNKWCLRETRFGVPVRIGKTTCYLHGQADYYDPRTRTLDDYKFTKAEAMLFDAEENTAQLNLLAWILRKNCITVDRVRNVYLFRNWDARKVKEGSNYPTEQIKVVDVPLWDNDRCEAYAIERAKAHIRAESTPDDELPFCTDQERWVRGPKFKVIKLDPKTGERQKVSKFRSESRLACEDYIEQNATDAKGNPIKYDLIEVPGLALRCRYCDIAPFCNQFKSEAIADGEGEEDGS